MLKTHIRASAIGVWKWDGKAQRYRNKKGQFISSTQMVELRDKFVDYQRQHVRDLTQRMADKEITWNEWKRQMQATIRLTHMDLLSLGAGGRRQVTQKQWDNLAFKVLPEQYKYLDDFGKRILNGEHSLLQAQLYAEHYIGVARTSYEAGRRAANLAAGFTEEKNVLNPAKEHCKGCEVETQRGWQKINSLVPPGARSCLGNCHCSLIYR
jgi:hypothetical protein